MAYSIYMYFSPELLPFLDKRLGTHPLLSGCFDLPYKRIVVYNELFAYFKPRGSDKVISEYLDECLTIPVGLLSSLAEDDVPSKKKLLLLKLNTSKYSKLLPFYRANS